MSFTEEGTFDKATKIWRWKLIPGSLGDKVRSEGAIKVEPVGSDKVRRITECTIEANVFGIGGLIESSAEKQTREAYDAHANFMNKCLKRAG